MRDEERKREQSGSPFLGGRTCRCEKREREREEKERQVSHGVDSSYALKVSKLMT